MTFTLQHLRRLYSLLPCLVLLPGLLAAGSVQDCPFGQLELPRDYRSGRTTVQHWIDARSTVTLGEMSGAGCLRHIWMTFNGAPDSTELGLHLVLRIYTDGKQHPDVEVPVSAFFCQFHGLKPGPIDSPFLQVTARGGLNSYFPMPYADGMRITLENPTDRSFDIYWQGDHQSYPEGKMTEPRRFRAVYRRINPASAYADPFIIGHGTNRGFLAGVSMGMQVTDRSDAWYHNGGDLILLDGRTGSPAVLGGIGGEDFFGNAYGMEAFSNGPIGAPYYIEADDAPKFLDFGQEGEEVDADDSDAEPYLVFAAYRFYERDPIVFRSDFSIRFGAYENDIATVLYWYEEGNDPLPFHLPPPTSRLPGTRVDPGVYDRAPADVRRWNVCGPFPAETRAEFERSEFPEQRQELGESRPADFGYYRIARERGAADVYTKWTQGARSINGFLDLRPFHHTRLPTNFAFPRNVAAYASTVIFSEEERESVLRIGHDDWLRVWLNGRLIYDGTHQKRFRSEELSIRLDEGPNRFLVKSAVTDNYNMRAWVFQFEVAGE